MHWWYVGGAEVVHLVVCVVISLCRGGALVVCRWRLGGALVLHMW